VLADDDIVFGTWDSNTRQFVENGPVTNAVRVTVRRSNAHGNPAPTFFLHIFGQSHVDLSAGAMAGVVLSNHLTKGPNGEDSVEDSAKLDEMQEALDHEQERRLGELANGQGQLMNDQEVAEFLLEEFGKAVLLK
jgi:putative Tad-like protein involved in Flp pilus assembly